MGYPHFGPTVLWNLPLPSEPGINKPASVFAFSQDDKLLITLHDCQGGILWDLTASSLPRKIEFAKDDVCLRRPVKSALLVGANLGLIVVFGIDHAAQHYDILDEASGLTSSPSKSVLPAANDVKVSRDGKLVVFATGTTVELWDASSFQKIRVLTSQVSTHGPFEKVAISQDGNYTAGVDSQGRFSVWGLADGFHRVSRNEEVGVEIGDGWSPTSIGLNERTFVIAVMRKRALTGNDAWMLVSWGYKYEGPDNTLHAEEYSDPNCALACAAPSTEFNVVLAPDGNLNGMDGVFWKLFGTGQGASKKGKVISCGISGSSKLFAAARTNGRLTVWRLYTKDADPNEPYPG